MIEKEILLFISKAKANLRVAGNEAMRQYIEGKISGYEDCLRILGPLGLRDKPGSNLSGS